MNRFRLNAFLIILSSLCTTAGFANCAIKTELLQSKAKNTNPTPYLLPKNHRLQRIVDKLFSNPKVTESPKNFAAAGFKTLYIRPKGALRVARHPSVKGYLFKLYLASESRASKSVWQNSLIQRCVGASAVRKLIKENNLRQITVPEKWLYQLPTRSKGVEKSYVLIAEDMNLVSHNQSKKMWQKASPSLLKELHILLKSGQASIALVQNIPFTKDGKCSCIDTEYAPRRFHLTRAKKFFSPKMQKYWDSLH